jgi:hypothetical protein
MAACAVASSLLALGALTAASRAGAGPPSVAPLAVATGAVPYIGSLAVAGNAGGQFVVAWVGANGVYARRGSVGGALGATQLLASGGVPDAPIFSAVAAAIAPDGSAAVGWDRSAAGEGELEAAAAPAGSSFGAVQTLAQKKAHNPLPGLHLAAVDGRLVALWFAILPAGHTLLYYAIAGGDRRFAPAVALSSTAAHPPAVAALGSGTIVATWSARAASGAPDLIEEAVLARAATAFGPTLMIAPAGAEPGNQFAQPSLTGSTSGDAALAFGYTPNAPQARPLVEVTSIGPTGQAAATAVAGRVKLPPASAEWGFWGPVAAASTGGSTIAAWVTTTYPAGKPQTPSDLYVALRPVDGSFGSPKLLVSSNDLITDPVAAAAGAGAVLVWPQFTRPPAGADYNDAKEMVMVSVAEPGSSPAAPTAIATTVLDDSGPYDPLALSGAGSHAIVAIVDADTHVLSLYPIAP